MNVRARFPLLAGGVLGLVWSLPATAGCHLLNHANFQISQSAFLEVSRETPPGEVVRKGTVLGDGVELLKCDAGMPRFRGLYVTDGSEDFRVLTVGGRKSGLGVRLQFTEQDHAVERNLPFDIPRVTGAGEVIRGDGDALYYEIFRTADDVQFGTVDTGPVAYTDVEDGSGGFVRFRSMMIYELTLTRPACSIAEDDLRQRVELPAYSTAHFDPIDRATPWTAFHLRVARCSDPDGLFANITFGVPGDAMPGHPAWFSLPQGGPEHVALEIGDAAHATVRPGEPLALPALGTGERYDFAVRLREAGGPAGAGTFERGVRVDVEYR